jgi:hypothetical protein
MQQIHRTRILAIVGKRALSANVIMRVLNRNKCVDYDVRCIRLGAALKGPFKG